MTEELKKTVYVLSNSADHLRRLKAELSRDFNFIAFGSVEDARKYAKQGRRADIVIGDAIDPSSLQGEFKNAEFFAERLNPLQEETARMSGVHILTDVSYDGYGSKIKQTLTETAMARQSIQQKTGGLGL